MSAEPNNSPSASGGDGPSGSGDNGWPDRTEQSGEWWGRRHHVPMPSDSDRLHMFAKPVKMSEEEKERILTNWRGIAHGHGAAFAMNHDLRPSTPRDVRADRRIQKLRDEGVLVDPSMESHIRNVIEGKNSGLHDALRHYTQGEENVLLPYLNELAHREDRILLEWAKQKKQAYHDYQERSTQRDSSPRDGSEGQSQSDRIQEIDSAGIPIYEEADIADGSGPSHEGPSKTSKGKSSSRGESGTSKTDKTNTTSQAEPSTAPKVNKGLVQARREQEAERNSTQQKQIEMILVMEAQISGLDRNLKMLERNASPPSRRSSNATSSSTQRERDPYDRVFERLRNILEEKQRRLCTLNKARSRVARGAPPESTPPSPEPAVAPTPQPASQAHTPGGTLKGRRRHRFLGGFMRTFDPLYRD